MTNSHPTNHSTPALGIDTGAHAIHAAVIGANGPEHVPMEGKTGQRNAVWFDGQHVLIGDQAVNAHAANPATYAEQLKPYLGQRDEDGSPYTVIPGIGEKGKITDLHAAIYEYVRLRAEAHLAHPVSACVLAHPDAASQLVKDDLKAAAQAAGLQDVFFIGESQALLRYAHHRKPIRPGAMGIIVDNGHYTNNAVVFQVKDNLTLEVLNVVTSETCGGGEYTAAIEKNLRAELAKTGFEIDETNAQQLMALYAEAERVKHLLSERETAIGMLAFGKEPFKLMLAREHVEALWSALRKECLKTVSRALKDKAIKKDKLDVLILSGGNLNIPCLHRDICKLLGLEAERLPNAELAVAFGASLSAAELYRNEGIEARGGKGRGMRVLPIGPVLKRKTARNIAIKLFDMETNSDCMEILVPKGEPLPVRFEKRYSLRCDTMDEDCRTLTISILQPESEDQALDKTPVLTEFNAEGLAASVETKDRICVQVEISKDEQTTVRVFDTAAMDEKRPWSFNLD